MMNILRLLPLVLFLASIQAGMTLAQNKGVIVVADDLPITDYDITQKINLLKVLGSDTSRLSRKQVLKGLVDDVVKVSEARRLNVAPSRGEIDTQIGRIAKNMNLTSESLLAKLKERGVASEFFRRFVSANIGFSRVVRTKDRDAAEKKEVTEADVDRKMVEIKSQMEAQVNKAMADPRMKAVTVLQFIQYDLPIENDDPGLLQARAVEAQQVVRQFKGCKNPRAASAGVFNVKVGKMAEADASKIPPELRKALTSGGAGRAIGPLRGKGSLQVIGYCGSRKITPPRPKYEMPTREQVRNALENQQFSEAEEKHLVEARKRVYIEYRDQSYAN